MNPLVWGPLIGGITGVVGSWLLYRSATTATRGTEKLEGVKVQMDGWERLHKADVAENDRLKAALIEERTVSQSFAAKAERLEAENAELRARLSEGMGDV